MKRLLTCLLALSLIFSLAACGSKTALDTPQVPDKGTPAQGEVERGGQAPEDAKPEDAQPEKLQPAVTEAPNEPEQIPEEPVKKAEEPAESKPAAPAGARPAEELPAESPAEDAEDASVPSSNGAQDILSTVWAAYADEEKFPADAPTAMDISDTDTLSYLLTFPADDLGRIDGAAALIHMMNLNTFTCGAFHTVSSADASALAADLQSAIQSKHWMCGFPEKLVIVTMEQYVIAMYGHEDLIDTFRDKLLASFPTAAVAYDEAISL